MPLHTQAQDFLRELASQDTPPIESLPPKEARAQMLPAVGPFDPVQSIAHLSIVTPVGTIPIRIYVPDNVNPSAAGKLPALVYYHGGGWVLGTLDSYEGLCRSLAFHSSCVVIAVDYRLAPEHRYPAALEDAYAAVCWVADHAELWNLDPERIGVAGDSAGGNLAASVCLQARDQGAPRLAYQALLYPIVDCDFETRSYCENGLGYGLTRSTMAWFWDQYLPDVEERKRSAASPLRAATLCGLPPAFVLIAEFDPLRDEGEAYANRLRSDGVPVQVMECAGLIHGFLRRPHVFGDACRFLKAIGQAARTALRAPAID